MPRTCTVCSHERREAIDGSLVGGVSYRDIAKQHSVTPSALTRHRREHLSPALVAVTARRQAAHEESLVDRIERLIARLEPLYGASANVSDGVKVLAEIRKQLELVARLTGELDQRPQVQVVNLHTSPDWQALQATIMGALARHPEAKADVLAAISGAPAPRVIEGRVIEG